MTIPRYGTKAPETPSDGRQTVVGPRPDSESLWASVMGCRRLDNSSAV